MRNLVVLAWALAGCLGSTFEATPDGGGGGNPDLAQGGGGGGGPDLAGQTGSDVSGPIMTDSTWSGLINVTASVTVTSGVTLTVAAVAGALRVQGTAASGVKLQPIQQGGSWGGISVTSGGSLDLAYATLDQGLTPISCAQGALLCKADHTALTNYTGVGMLISAPATFTYCRVEKGGSDGISVNAAAAELVIVTDSSFHATGGDAIVVNGGNLTFQHNTVYGDMTGTTPTGQHCACHFASAGTFLVDHNDFYNSAYGLMASDMSATSKINQNNFYSDTNLWGTADGNGVNALADLTNDYWGGGPPPLITGNINTTPYSTTKIAGTGPR